MVLWRSCRVESVRGCLQDGPFDPGVDHVPEVSLQVKGLGCRLACFVIDHRAGDAHGDHNHSSGRPSSWRYPLSPGSHGLEDHDRVTSKSSGRSDGDAHGADNRNSGRPSSGHYPLSPGPHGTEDHGRVTSRSSRRHDATYDRPAVPPAAPASSPPPQQRVLGAHVPGWNGRVYSPGTLPSDNNSVEELRRFDVMFNR